MKFEKYLAIAAIFILTACSGSEQVAVESAASMASTETTDAMADNRPNILFIVADDLGFTDLGAFGSEIPTPNLDALAMQGLRMNSLHAGPACQATRAMLMASAGYTQALEIRPALPSGERDNLLSRDWVTIPELMQEAGYSTYMAGKWDLGLDEGYTPATRGFDKSFAQLGASSSFFREYFMTPDNLWFEDNGVSVQFDDLDEDFYVTNHYTDKMLEFLLDSEEGKPWFAFMPYTAPHWPLQLPDDWLDRHAGNYDMGYDELREQRYQRALELGVLPSNASMENFQSQAEPWAALTAEEQRRYARAQEIYAGMIEHLDMSIGRVIDHLKESGQFENTVIVFTSDHGASSGEHGVDTGRLPQSGGPRMPDHIDNSLENFGKIGSFIDHGRGFGEAASAPLRYFKGSLAEGGLRAASFVRYPAAVEAGGVTQAFMTMMDFLPTFLEIAGTEHPGAGDFQGREVKDILGHSIWPHLTGQATEVHSADYVAGWSNGDSGTLIRGDGYKIINTLPPGQRGATDWRLYNIEQDPGEHFDVSSEHSELVQELVQEWEANWQ